MIINRQIGGSGGESASIFVQGLSATDTVSCTKDGKSYSGRWVSNVNPLYVLPSGYTQLEYIESSGTQYIDTGLSMPSGWNISGTILLTSVGDEGGVFGCEASINNTHARNDFQSSWAANKSWFVGYGGYAYGGTPLANAKYKIDVSNTIGNDPYIKINDNTISLTVGQSDTGIRNSMNCYLMASHHNAGYYRSYMRIYDSFKVWNHTNTLVRNFIPCKRNSDSSIGMYDLVTNTFYGNSGSGTFIAGSEIPSTISGWQFDNLKEYGTYTITSGSKTQNVLVDFATEFDISL